MGLDWDTKVPIGLVLGMVGQGIVLLFAVTVWGALIDSRVANIETAIQNLNPFASQVALINTRLDIEHVQFQERLARNEDRLERLERYRGIYDSGRDSRRNVRPDARENPLPGSP